MSKYKYTTDFYFTDDGDFRLGSDGDFEDTANYQYRGLIQRVITRLSSAKGEWRLQPLEGVNLTDFLGKPNTREVGGRVRERVYSELIRDNLVSPADLKVEVFPLSKTEIAILVVITPPDIASKIFLTFSYDMKDNKLHPRNI